MLQGRAHRHRKTNWSLSVDRRPAVHNDACVQHLGRPAPCRGARMFSDIRVQTGGLSFRTAGKDGQPAVTAGARGRGIPEGGFVHCFQLLVLPGRRKRGSGDRQAERLVRRSSAPGPQRKRPGRSAPLRTLMLRPGFVSLLDAACQDEAAGTLRTHSFAPRVPSGGWSCPVLSAGSKREEKKNCCVQPQGDHTLETVLKKITLKRHFQDEADPSSTPGTGYRGTSAYPVTQVHPLWALGMGEQGPWVQPTRSAGPVTLGGPLTPPKPVCRSARMGESGGRSCFC